MGENFQNEKDGFFDYEDECQCSKHYDCIEDECPCSKHCGCMDEKEIEDQHGCTKTTFQFAEVKVPVKVTPYAKVGKIETQCCGNPVVIRKQCDEGRCEMCCEIDICQGICVKIPIEYRSVTVIGEQSIKCDTKSEKCECGKEK